MGLSTAKHNRIFYRINRINLLDLNLGEQIHGVTSGVPLTVSTRWAATPITPKFEELNRRAAIEDHRHRNAFRRRIRGSENFLSLHRGLKVVYFKRYVRDGLNQGVHWTIGLEAHPLNATRTRLKRGDVHLELFQIIFAWSWNVSRDADVVIPPATYRSGRRLVVPLP
jgi:hypothetical protein